MRANVKKAEMANSRLAKELMMSMRSREETKATTMYFKVTVTLRLKNVSTAFFQSADRYFSRKVRAYTISETGGQISLPASFGPTSTFNVHALR